MKQGMNSVQGHRARKQFGQNFLQDKSVISRLIQAINPSDEQTLVEIGPGLGALTEPLLAICKHLHVVELDRDLVSRLQQRFGAALTVHAGDALKFDFMQIKNTEKIAQLLRIVGNLPYNISSPLLFHLFEVADHVLDQHFMLQKEVVERMVAEPGTKAYGRLSVMLQHRYRMAHLFDVPPEAFIPAPKVDSAIVRMVPRSLSEMEQAGCDLHVLSKIVTLAFSQRRKMLRNTLAPLQAHLDFAALQFDLTRRAEEVSVDEYVMLARVIRNDTQINIDH